MAIRTQEEILTAITELIGEDTSDTALALLDDVSDTFGDLTVKANKDPENWEEKYHELDDNWRKRYAQRFNKGTNDEDDDDNDYENNSGFNRPRGKLTYENLFKEE